MAKAVSRTGFRDLVPRLSEATLGVVDSLGFTHATPVQCSTIPLFMSHKDVAVEAVTGSGKTLAFVLPLVEILLRLEQPLKKHQVGAIIISPTRELASQIFNVLLPFVESVLSPKTPGAHATVARLLVGGSDVAADIATFNSEGGNIFVGSPGRLEDLLVRSPLVDLSSLEVLVLDEADRLLDMGFERTITAILQRLPKQRRTGLFSATQTDALEELTRAGLRNPVRVEVRVNALMRPPTQRDGTNGDGGKDKSMKKGKRMRSKEEEEEERLGVEVDRKKKKKGKKAGDHGEDGLEGEDGGQEDEERERDVSQVAGARGVKTPVGLHIQYLECQVDEKPSQLAAFLQRHAGAKAIVYFMTCACVDMWSALMGRMKATGNVPFVALHGKMKQAAREKALSGFVSMPAGVLLCTDVAARGLDIPGVDWILQYDPPLDPRAFVHRVGRTARMGREGNAMVFISPKEDAYVEFLRLRGVPISAADKFEEAPDVIPQMRAAAAKDRAVMETGVRAFVSYVRGYKEHQCNFIFRYKDLEVGRLAMGFGLLRLPSMPELRHGRFSNAGFVPMDGIDTASIASIPFRDKAREKERQRRLKEQAEKESENGGEFQDARGAKKRADVSYGKDQLVSKMTKKDRVKRRAMMEEEDMEEDYRLLKKLKKGKISEMDFDQKIGLHEDVAEEKDASNSLGSKKQRQNREGARWQKRRGKKFGS